MAVLKSPFESTYGFRGNNFSVDENGNLTANTLTLLEVEDTDVEVPADFTVTSANNEQDYIFSAFETQNPSITISRGSRVIFELDLGLNTFSLYDNNKTTLLTAGLQHSDGTSGVQSQGKSTGRLFFTVPSSIPDIIFYGDLENNTFGTINVIDQDGSFNSVSINGENNTATPEDGALTVAGGVGIAKNLAVGEVLYVTDIYSDGDITFNARDEILFLSADSSLLGVINQSGSTIPINNTVINSTAIGDESPSTAVFTTASVINSPLTDENVTNKQYVDNTITALTIALGT